MAKIVNDKYYTPVDLARYCIDKTYEIIGKENITEIIEPSAGNGSFSNQLDCVAYDLYPESEEIIKQDYLELDLEYRKGRLIIGNPPYGRVNTLSVQFYKKSIMLGDYISFILPISQLNNNQQMYDFDMIHSEDLGIKDYSGKNVHCCLNIYRRNEKGLNSKPNNKLKDVTIVEYRRGDDKKLQKIMSDDFQYDIAICAWGNGTCGNIINYKGQYSTEFYIKVHNEAYRQEVIDFITDLKWKDNLKSTGGKKIQIWMMNKILKGNIKGLE